MPYADSAIDYNWEIEGLDVGNRTLTVKYTPADSADTSRPAVFLRHNVRYDQFNESDLTVIATDKFSEQRVVTLWDQVREANAANPGFNADSYIGNVYSSRYKVRTTEDYPAFNEQLFMAETYDSEGNDDIVTKYNVVAMSDSQKASWRESLVVERPNLWLALQRTSNLASVTSAFGIDSNGYDSYGVDDVKFITADKISFVDSVSGVIQGVLGLNDSDWATWLLDNSSATTQTEGY